ncbi:MAG: outer membrane beta-barrel protein [Candidatus Latescibacteria bacterium]|nr:outer membrane beta-barrel protein [Candidatus Latescibacterota bacterium]
MKRFSVVMCVVLGVCMIATTSDAQFNILDIDVNLSYPMPQGDFADGYKAGFGAGADVFVGLPMLSALKLGGRVAYNRFGVEDIVDGGNMSIIEILPSARFEISPPMSPVGGFAQLGVGLYNWSSTIEMKGLPDAEDDGADFGICVGAGVKVKIPGSVGLMAMPLYHIIFTEDEKTNYLSLNVGVIF